MYDCSTVAEYGEGRYKKDEDTEMIRKNSQTENWPQVISDL